MRQIGRKRKKPEVRAYGQWYGCGKQAEDGVSGWYFPVKFMTKQRGRLVSRDEADGSLDKPEEW